LAVHAYADIHAKFPEGCAYPFLKNLRDLDAHAGLSWHTQLLPFLEQEPLWSLAWKLHRENPIGESEQHGEVQKRTLAVLLCPSDSRRIGDYGWGLTGYRGVAGTRVGRNDGVFHRNYRVRFGDISDGTSNTLMIGERPPGPRGVFGAWFAGWGYAVCGLSQILPAGRIVPPASIYEARDCPRQQLCLSPGTFESDCDLNHFWSLHPGGANFALADGTVRFFSYSSAHIMPALATRNGGEAAPVPD
jgi:prepilin-type processing-associated H-X9-DG protein